MSQAADRPRLIPGARDALGSLPGRFSFAALTAQLIWGLNTSTMKITVTELDPYLIGAVRTALAGLILLVILARREGTVGIRSEHWPRMFLVAVVGMGLNTIFWQGGLSRSTATASSLISSVSPICGMLLAVALGQEGLVRRRAGGMLLALLGVALVITAGGLDLSGSTLVGDLFLIGSAWTWAAYNVTAVPLLRSYSPLRITTWAMLLGAGFQALVAPFTVQQWDVSGASPVAWFGLFYAVFFGTIIAHSLWTRTVQSRGASGTLIYSYLSPVLSVAFAAVLLGERLSPLQAVGALFVLGGVTLSNRSRLAKS